MGTDNSKEPGADLSSAQHSLVDIKGESTRFSEGLFLVFAAARHSIYLGKLSCICGECLRAGETQLHWHVRSKTVPDDILGLESLLEAAFGALLALPG